MVLEFAIASRLNKKNKKVHARTQSFFSTVAGRKRSCPFTLFLVYMYGINAQSEFLSKTLNKFNVYLRVCDSTINEIP